jgi:hypothetical protein
MSFWKTSNRLRGTVPAASKDEFPIPDCALTLRMNASWLLARPIRNPPIVPPATISETRITRIVSFVDRVARADSLVELKDIFTANDRFLGREMFEKERLPTDL